MTREQPATSPDYQERTDRNHGFVIGLLTGSVVGASLGWMFAPRISALGRRTADSIGNLGAAANDRYHQAGEHMAAVVDDLTEKGQDFRDQMSDAVIHGARAVEHQAEQMKSGR